MVKHLNDQFGKKEFQCFLKNKKLKRRERRSGKAAKRKDREHTSGSLDNMIAYVVRWQYC